MFDLDGNCLIVDRADANELFLRIGCVNVDRWDEDAMTFRLHRAPSLRQCGAGVGDLEPLIDAVSLIGPTGTIILRNDVKPSESLVSILEKKFSKFAGRRRSRGGRKRKRGELFSFIKCHIPPGSVLAFKRDPNITCKVVGDPWIVDFGDGEVRSFTSRTRELLGAKETTFLSPQFYWTFEGKLLSKYYEQYQRPKKRSRKKN